MRTKLIGWIWLLLVLLAACTAPGGGQAGVGVWEQSHWDQANWQ